MGHDFQKEIHALALDLILILFHSPNIATAIGPVLGGALQGYAGWNWIFWFLSLLSGSCLILLVLLLPETARSIVGNGSLKVSGVHRSMLSYLQSSNPSSSPKNIEAPESGPTVPVGQSNRNESKIPNPLESLKFLYAKDCALITLIFGIFYMNLSSLQASTSTLFIGLYDITEFQAGLIYLPSGIGSCIGAYGAGKPASFPSKLTHLSN